jgi:hypothetical protein
MTDDYRWLLWNLHIGPSDGGFEDAGSASCRERARSSLPAMINAVAWLRHDCPDQLLVRTSKGIGSSGFGDHG